MAINWGMTLTQILREANREQKQAERVKKENDRIRERRKKNGKGSVYVMYDNIKGPAKIGRANDVNKRLSSAKTSNLRIKLYGHVDSGDPVMLEKAIHDSLKASGVKWKREWFDITPEEAMTFVNQMSAANQHLNK